MRTLIDQHYEFRNKLLEIIAQEITKRGKTTGLYPTHKAKHYGVDTDIENKDLAIQICHLCFTDVTLDTEIPEIEIKFRRRDGATGTWVEKWESETDTTMIDTFLLVEIAHEIDQILYWQAFKTIQN
jgi:hypothetical protein